MKPPATLADTFCSECSRRIRYYPDRKEWGHVQVGGGATFWGCRDCYWRGSPQPSPVCCPVCLGTKLIDLHLATPQTSTPRATA